MALKWKDSEQAPRGVVIDYPTMHEDDRGWLAEIYRCDESNVPALMGYVSQTVAGGVRGPHLHARQTDRFVFVDPFELYLWDTSKRLRRSGVAGTRFKCVVGPMARVIIPPGIVHAYANHRDRPGYVINLPDQLYCGVGKQLPPDEERLEENPHYRLW